MLVVLRLFAVLMLVSEANMLLAQTYDDFLGAGHEIGMQVSSSSDEGANLNAHVISGTQMTPDLIGASRFLSQATLGSSYEDLMYVSDVGIDAWLNEQFELPVKSFESKYDQVFSEINQLIVEDDHSNNYMSFVFYEFVMKEPDVLRQKVAFALSQIFVISPYHGSSLNNESWSNMTYYDYLYQGAFDNYKNLLSNITYSYPMGNYLSHFMNQKADIIEKTYPDENFAREIMQLFSIGLHLLNEDGTPVKDADGNNIPTYNIDNIAEMAKIFTGLAAGITEDGLVNDYFFRDWGLNERAPMVMFDDYHTKGEKNILPGVVIPAGQSGIQDVNQTIDVLFNHQNVAPFISKRLIQHIVKSNPSPAYVKRISTVFKNNGSGVRGDLKAVIKAILLDPEARDCDWIDQANNGKLIQPIERFTSIFKAFKLSTPSNKIWFRDFGDVFNETGQSFLGSPSVFNFFSPFYAEDEFVAPLELLSPEFQILNSVTAIAYINEMEDVIKIRPFKNRTASNDTGDWLAHNVNDDPVLDFTDELNIYSNQGVSALLERLDVLICRGQLSDATKNIIANAILQNETNDNGYTDQDALEDVLYYIMMSPNYLIQK